MRDARTCVCVCVCVAVGMADPHARGGQGPYRWHGPNRWHGPHRCYLQGEPIPTPCALTPPSQVYPTPSISPRGCGAQSALCPSRLPYSSLLFPPSQVYIDGKLTTEVKVPNSDKQVVSAHCTCISSHAAFHMSSLSHTRHTPTHQQHRSYTRTPRVGLYSHQFLHFRLPTTSTCPPPRYARLARVGRCQGR